MKNQLLAITAATLLLAGQSAFAGNDAEEFLSWLDNAGQETTAQVEQSNQFSTVSMKDTNNVDTSYNAEEDIFSIHYMSNN